MSNEDKTAIATYTPTGTDIGDPLWDPAVFAHMWRVSQMFAASQMVPSHMRGKPEDCFLALAMAKRSGQEPLSVLQSIHFVKGKAGWASTYLIARAKLAGMPIRWDVAKLQALGNLPNFTVTAWSLVDGERVETTITMQDAKDEGWTSNPKYKTMGETMLRYRTATRLVRLYMPEILLGLPPAEELETIAPVQVESVVSAARATLDAIEAATGPLALEDSGDVPTLDEAPEPAPTPKPKAKPKKRKPKAKPAPVVDADGQASFGGGMP